jgi:hypothetical protein
LGRSPAPATAATALAGLSFNGLDGIAPTSRGLLCDTRGRFAFAVDCTQAKEFALAHWLVNGADAGRLFVRCFGGDGIVRENAAGGVLASLTTMVWNAPSKSWTGGATMADASLNRRMTVRLGDAVAFAQIGTVGLDGQIELEALRLYGLPETAPALLCGTPGWATWSEADRRGNLDRSKARPERKTGAAEALTMALGRAMHFTCRARNYGPARF